MLIVIGTARLGENELEEARAVFEPMISASRKEEGCIDYAYSLDVLDARSLRIVEKWVDEAALEAHFKTPHMADFQSALRDLDVTVTEVLKFQTDEGAPLF